MPLLKSRRIVISNRRNIYRRGDELKGTVSFELCKPVVVYGIHVHLTGQSLASFMSEASSVKNPSAMETYTDQVLTVFGNPPDCDGPEIPITVGEYKYEFSFKLPGERLPSSFEGEHGVIRYWIMAKVARPSFKWDELWYCPITVINDYDVNRPEFLMPVTRTKETTVSKTLGLGIAGKLSLTVTISRTAYCPGESIAINANNSSAKNLGPLKAQLVQKVIYSDHDYHKTFTATMREIEGMDLLKGEKREWKDQMMEIDPMPQSTNPHSCHNVKVRYSLRVLVNVPMGFDLECDIPILIGAQPPWNSMDDGEPNDVCGQPEAPVSDLPPPYSEVAGCQEHHDVSQVQETGSVYGILLLRFPDRYLQEFRDSMEKETSTTLPECGGRVIALAPQTLIKPSTWPKRTAIAMVRFTNEESGSEWFGNTPEIKGTGWMQSCDAVVVTMEEIFNEGNDVYSIVSKEYRDEVSQTDKQMYNKMFGATVVPLRIRKNGVGSVKEHKLLQGSWLTDKWTLTITQWENLLQYHEYKNEFQGDVYHGMRDLMSKNFSSVDEVVFQSEDLSP